MKKNRQLLTYIFNTNIVLNMSPIFAFSRRLYLSERIIPACEWYLCAILVLEELIDVKGDPVKIRRIQCLSLRIDRAIVVYEKKRLLGLGLLRDCV